VDSAAELVCPEPAARGGRLTLHTCPRLFRRHRQQYGWDAAVGATALGNLSGEKFSVARKLPPVGTRLWSRKVIHGQKIPITLDAASMTSIGIAWPLRLNEPYGKLGSSSANRQEALHLIEMADRPALMLH
jgi:hypothetical protein